MEDISNNLNKVLEIAKKETDALTDAMYDLKQMNEVLNDFADEYEANSPFALIANAANVTLKLQQTGTPNAISLEYSTDKMNWSTYKVNDIITLANIGDKVYFRGDNPNGINQYSVNPWNNYYNFALTGRTLAYGNIMSLIDKTMQTTVVPSACFFRMFYQQSLLYRAPKLPATDIRAYGYATMFNHCNIVEAPELPAMTLEANAYNGMFQNCASLEKAPYLPATTLAQNCYGWMFSGCVKLHEVSVAFTSWSSGATNTWFENLATSYGTFKCPAALDTSTIARNVSTIPAKWNVVNI